MPLSKRNRTLYTSQEMLGRVRLLSSHRDRLVEHQVAFAWAVVYMGIPSARLLSVKLLKQSKYPQLYPLTLPRFEVVQNLSIFIGCLSSIHPLQGNHRLCVRMRKLSDGCSIKSWSLHRLSMLHLLRLRWTCKIVCRVWISLPSWDRWVIRTLHSG